MVPICITLFSRPHCYAPMNLTALFANLVQCEKGDKDTYLLMLMVIAALMCLEFIDPAVPFLAELTVERLAGFAGGLCLCMLSETGVPVQDRMLAAV